MRKYDPNDDSPHWLDFKILGYWVDAWTLGILVGVLVPLLILAFAYLSGGFCHG